jgi:hypothetical protein
LRADRRFRPIPLEAVTLLSEGKMIDAIKSVRAAEGVGLKEAKQRVHEYIAQDPILRVQIETQQHATRRKLFFWFVVVDLAVAAGVIYWLYHRGSI